MPPRNSSALVLLPHSVTKWGCPWRHGLSTNAVMDFTVQQLEAWSITLPVVRGLQVTFSHILGQASALFFQNHHLSCD